ncbi:MAG: hypothetical protein KC457_00955 [Myxococcales bacterium]|nr:hypothetical protein [Myxococcales bacterium]
MFETQADGTRPQSTQATRDLDGDVATSLVRYASPWRAHANNTVGTTLTELVPGTPVNTVRDLPTSVGDITITTTDDAGMVLIGYLNSRGFERTTVIQWSGAGTFPAPGSRVQGLRITSAIVGLGRETLTAPISVQIGAAHFESPLSSLAFDLARGLDSVSGSGSGSGLGSGLGLGLGLGSEVLAALAARSFCARVTTSQA